MSGTTEQGIELVITVPEPYGAEFAYRTRSRSTLGVLTQLFAEAHDYVVIAAPFLQPGYGLSSGILSAALTSALQRGVNVDIVSTRQGLQTLDLPRLRQGARGQLRFLRPQTNLEEDQRIGSHAKFCIADGEQAYVGSANLTDPGLSGQLEMGLFVRANVARQIDEFWHYAVEIGLFKLV